MIDYIGTTSGSILPPGQKVRATFRQNLVGAVVQGDPLDNIRGAYKDLQEEAGAFGVYVVSALNAGPGDKAFTVDLRVRQTTYQLGAASLAAELDFSMPTGWNLIRLEAVGAGAETAGEASQHAADATQAATDKPVVPGITNPLTKFYEGLQSVGRWFLVVLALLAVLLLVYYFRP